MKRNMDLIRRVAFKIEDAVGPIDSKGIAVDGFSPEEIGYHVELMNESGLIVAIPTSHMQSKYPEFQVSRLSSAGHDFVDAARNDTVWNKAVENIRGKVGGVSIDLLVTYLKRQAASLLGLEEE